ncbi:MAG TPA: hypothetical protein PK191_06205 [Niabella sp.]|nr:hypothetical protein [Niabella sp.]HOZ95617.1 hypothetical protein [Niabella sp.]HQW13857.1 hypothetical protein [Niabella sp.]HQX19250.1 hypothetical protein [Niabella sp.]HQX41031.1 hypothetical protein [Niabella sp.]
MNTSFILIPIISAFLGWLVCYLGIKYFVNNYITRKKDLLISNLSAELQKLLPFSKLEEKIASGDLIEKAMPGIEKHIDEFLNVKLQKEIPMLAMFIGNKTTDKVKEVFINQLRELFPQVMNNMVGDLKDSLNIEILLKNKMQESDIKLFISTKLYHPIRNIQLISALAGFLIGMVNVLIFWGFQ